MHVGSVVQGCECGWLMQVRGAPCMHACSAVWGCELMWVRHAGLCMHIDTRGLAQTGEAQVMQAGGTYGAVHVCWSMQVC